MSEVRRGGQQAGGGRALPWPEAQGIPHQDRVLSPRVVPRLVSLSGGQGRKPVQTQDREESLGVGRYWRSDVHKVPLRPEDRFRTLGGSRDSRVYSHPWGPSFPQEAILYPCPLVYKAHGCSADIQDFHRPGHGPHWQTGSQTPQQAPLSPHHPSAASGPARLPGAVRRLPSSSFTRKRMCSVHMNGGCPHCFVFGVLVFFPSFASSLHHQLQQVIFLWVPPILFSIFSHAQIYTRSRTCIPTHTDPVLTLCLTKVRFYQHRRPRVLLLSLGSTSWDTPSIEQLYRNPAHHRPAQGRRLPSAGVTAGHLSTDILTCGARAPWGRTQSRGPRVCRLTMQLWDIFQS